MGFTIAAFFVPFFIEKVEEDDFKDIYGGFYDGFNTNSNWSILFYQFFLLRRIALAAAVIFGTFSVYF